MQSSYSVMYFRAKDEQRLVKDIFAFRKALFVDIYDWDLEIVSDGEQDRFDNPDTIYSVLYNHGRFVGMFRAIRADQPYLGETVFPELSKLRPYPKSREFWEISRFGVVPDVGIRHAEMNYAAMIYFALRVGAKGLVAVADLTYERFLSMLGIRSVRYGAPQVIGRSRNGLPLTAVAGEIPLAEQTSPKFHRFLSLIEKLEIRDVSQIFGPSRISA
ncbi:acyl-homoserine-lactone synthase [Methylosinus sp. R-45379]|uniref:acyl-homoserine-lactone synthase n=1 Tax=Methylosinus sp. R-45379 TaxID=980563 RepID=UPI000A06512B